MGMTYVKGEGHWTGNNWDKEGIKIEVKLNNARNHFKNPTWKGSKSLWDGTISVTQETLSI